MPWTVDDVDKFKKGLSPAEKTQWVRVANSILKKCKEAGGAESTCAASAIRQASGSIGAHSTIKTKNENYTIRREQLEGREWLVVPVVMMVEGVHHGSRGAMFHSIDELGRFEGAWNGIPVTIDHPQIDGQNVSANIPVIIDTRTVGRIFNTHVEGDKLKAEAWIDPVRLNSISAVTLAQLNANEIIEVSVGVFTEEEDAEGTWNGEQYTAIARHHRPDHLALLPGGTGACSVSDGCGTRNHNKKKGEKNEMNANEIDVAALKEAAVQKIIQGNQDQGYLALVQAARRRIDAMDSEDVVHFVEEIYDDFLIYRASMRIGGTRYYKQSYTLDTAGSVELVGVAQQVNQKIDYVPVVQRTNFNNKKKEVEMENNQNPPCGQCMEKVIAIINSNKTQFTVADMEWLTQQSEEVLNKLLPAGETIPGQTAPAAQVNKQTITSEDILNAMSAEDKAALDFGREQLAERRANMTKAIQDNFGKEQWSDDVLKSMDDKMLIRVFKSIKKEETVDYSLQGFQTRQIIDNSAEVPVMLPTGFGESK